MVIEKQFREQRRTERTVWSSGSDILPSMSVIFAISSKLAPKSFFEGFDFAFFLGRAFEGMAIHCKLDVGSTLMAANRCKVLASRFSHGLFSGRLFPLRPKIMCTTWLTS